MEKKIRKMTKQLGPLAGFKGTVKEMTYGTAIKIGMPSRDRYDPNHALDAHFSMTIVPSAEDDWRETQKELIDHVNMTLDKSSQERLEYWKEQLGLDE